VQASGRCRIVALGGTLFVLLVSATAQASTGPGPVDLTVAHSAYRVSVRISPNDTARLNTIAIAVTRRGRPVAALARAVFEMSAMPMPALVPVLRPSARGRIASAPFSLSMFGRWRVTLTITPAGGRPFRIAFLDAVE
jgi:hypothetical protein